MKRNRTAVHNYQGVKTNWNTGLHQSMSTLTRQRDSGEVKGLKFDPLVSCEKRKDDLSYSGNEKTTIEGEQRMEEITDFLHHPMKSTSCKHSLSEPSMRHGPSLDTEMHVHELEFLEHGHKMSIDSEHKKLSLQDVEDD